MKRDMRPFLQDIWESILAIEKYTQQLTREQFFRYLQVQDAVVRRLEIIGEAAKHISEDFRRKHPGIAWKEIAGMRDVLIHEYFGVKQERVWEMVKKDLPELKKQLRVIIEEESG